MNKNTLALNDTLDQMDLTDIYRTFYLKAREFFLSTYGIISRTDHMLGHITSIHKFKTIEYCQGSLWNKWDETRNQVPEGKWKIHKYMEIKQPATEQPRRNQKRKNNTLREMKIETQHPKT